MKECIICEQEECDILIKRPGYYHKDCLNECECECEFECLICNMECDTLLPFGGYCHEDCLIEWFDKKKLDVINDDLYEFINTYDSKLNILSENDIKLIDIAYKIKEKETIDDIFFQVNHSCSKKASDIFRYMLNKNMIIQNVKSDIKNEKNVNVNNEQCKIRDECIGHKSSYKTGRCGGSICDDCGNYSGICMSTFEHCCCYNLI